MSRLRVPLAAAFANAIAKVLLTRGVFVPRGDTAVRFARGRPAGRSTGLRKAIRGYRTRYTHVMTQMATDNNLARMAQRRNR